MLPLNVFIPNESGLKELWKHFDGAREHMPGLASDIVGFIMWICSADAMTLLVGPADAPVGAFVFTGIVPDESAWCHMLVWDLRAVAHKHEDLVESAQAACASVMKQFNLHRLNGSTPETNLPALRFAKRVGFVQEGVAREAARCGAGWQNLHYSGLLAGDLERAITAHQRDRMEEKES